MKNLQSYDGGETIITRFGKTEVFDWSNFKSYRSEGSCTPPVPLHQEPVTCYE